MGKDASKEAKTVSLRKFQINKKYWAKPDELYKNEVDQTVAKSD